MGRLAGAAAADAEVEVEVEAGAGPAPLGFEVVEGVDGRVCAAEAGRAGAAADTEALNEAEEAVALSVGVTGREREAEAEAGRVPWRDGGRCCCGCD
jgi:hypothetical protein